jgi:Prokaryotic RING finger family 1
MTPPSPAQQPRATSVDEAGRSCPYCRFALKQGSSIVECGSCRALHHAECWTDNGGCSIMGCAGAATAGSTTTAPAAAPPPPPPIQQQPAGYASSPPPPPPSSDRGRSSTALILAVLVLALAVAGGATALVVSSGNSTDAGASPATVTQVVAQTPVETVPPAATTTTGEEPPADTTVDEPPPSNGALPDEDEAQMASDIQSVLLAHHEAIVRQDFRAAWVLTSERYRAKKLREPGGYGAWETAQASLSRYLDPSGLQVSVTGTDPRSGVATVRVSGMGWSAPRSSCSSWEGITWAKYENDHWRYEPGYSISDQRRAEWQPRRDELLGWGC